MAATVPVAPRPIESTVPPLLRTGRTIGVLVALALAAFLALTSSPTEPATGSSTSDAAGLAVATGDLVNRVAAVDDVTRVTGGYVPNVGVVLTTQVDELTSGGIDEWVAEQLAGQQALIDLLDPAEDVIFLLDIAEPERISRLVAVSPGEISPTGAMTSREAPAISTAPLRPTFEPLPED